MVVNTRALINSIERTSLLISDRLRSARRKDVYKRQIDDAFGLGQGHTAVHQRAAGVLPGLRRSSPRGNGSGDVYKRQMLGQ